MKARVLINDVATNGSFSKSMLIKLARMGASIVAFPETGTNGEPVDMNTSEGFDYMRNYNGK